jgi:hypothetical protein
MIDASRWRKIEDLFHQALEQPECNRQLWLRLVRATTYCLGESSRYWSQKNLAHLFATNDALCSGLVWAFGHVLQLGFDDEVRAAWTAVIQAVNEQMKIGAVAVPA